MIYEILLLVGGIGLIAQMAFGFTHGGHGGHAGHGGHTGGGGAGHAGHNGVGGGGHAHVGTHAAATAAHHGHAATATNTPSAHSHASSQHAGGKGGDTKGNAGLLWLNLISPLNLFSIALGAGAVGLALRHRIDSPLLVALAAAFGGVVFYALLVRPLKDFILKFASKPAETLTGCVAQQVEAVSRFDGQGRGLIQAVVDGQVVQVLAHLETEDRQPQAATVAPGERLVVTAVDASKNVVHVTRMG